MMLPRVAARVFDAPLLIDARKAAAIIVGIGGRIVDGAVELAGGVEPVQHIAFEGGRPSLGKIGARLERAFESRGLLPFDMVEGVAVIPVEGTLVHKGAFVGSSSGETSYQGIQAQVRSAMRSEKVRGVVLEIDSFGGEAAGAFETADMVAELSAAKPTIAILTDFALSGGYLLAAAARQIVMPEFGRAGSIGVVRIHVDYSKKLEKDGVTVSIIAAGKHKADGNQFQPLPDEMKARMQAEAEAMRIVFAEHVGRFRGTRFNAAAAMATEADDFQAADAFSRGMVDGVGKGNEAFDAFVAEINRTR